MKTANPTTIEITDLVKDIKGKRIIDHVNLHLESGKITGLKGVNGSGKTMLMRLVCGLITPTSGSIVINGKRLGKDITFPESVGILIENPAFLDAYSGFDNLKLLASIKHSVGPEEIRQTIARVGLDPDDKKKYRKYSLGMKQRLGIAAAVMEEPDIIILDEPTNALDSDGVAMLKEILHDQRERGALVLISCHDLPTLQELSDEIYLMESGALRPYEEED
ncbi:MAG TPA: ATP-binding cassette domain-containing protein [Firmicutes bacterium]|nr:ATP-binding cassette domain-containing protein [Bacillota bacterium]